MPSQSRLGQLIGDLNTHALHFASKHTLLMGVKSQESQKSPHNLGERLIPGTFAKGENLGGSSVSEKLKHEL
jgi:hypothetical protein